MVFHEDVSHWRFAFTFHAQGLITPMVSFLMVSVLRHLPNETDRKVIGGTLDTGSGFPNPFGDVACVNFGNNLDSSDVSDRLGAVANLRVGLIDGHRLSQECLVRAFDELRPQLKITTFSRARECIDQKCAGLNLILYCAHAYEAQECSLIQEVTALRKAFPSIPLIVMSDAGDAYQQRTIRTMLKSGAQGFIPARTTSIAMTYAAIRFVAAGGTFAPLLTNQPERDPAVPEAARGARLTSRQLAVLSHMQQGKANKNIAYELGMSQSTVKVHVRNIMRKMGATNRTEAAFKAQKIWGGREFVKTECP